MLKWIFLGMAIQAFVTAGTYLIGFPDTFGRQLITGLIFLALAAALALTSKATGIGAGKRSSA